MRLKMRKLLCGFFGRCDERNLQSRSQRSVPYLLNSVAIVCVCDFRRCVQNANHSEWRLDVDRIAAFGDSAGAIMALYMAYVPTPEGNSGNPGYSSAVHAAIALSGELRCSFCFSVCKNGTWNRLDQIRNHTQPPMLIMHGTKDPIVPYRCEIAPLHDRCVHSIWHEALYD